VQRRANAMANVPHTRIKRHESTPMALARSVIKAKLNEVLNNLTLVFQVFQ
jgi:hypothetical protein